MARNEQTRFWPYDNDQNLLANEILEAEPRDTAARTLPLWIPGPVVDLDGRPLPENDPRRREQRFDTGLRIALDGNVAPALLQFNTHNRKLSQSNVNTLTRIVLDGDWCFNAKSSRLPCSNTAILDLQHTINAVAAAFIIGREQGILVRPIVLEPFIGLHPQVFSSYDDGKGRNTSDTLYVGARSDEIDLVEVREATWSHALRLFAQYANVREVLAPSDPFYMESLRVKLPNSRVKKLVNLAPQLQESLAYCSRYNIPQRNALISHAVVGAVHAIISETQSPTAANTFTKGLVTGVGLEETSPIHQLREQMIRDNNCKTRAEGIEELAMCIRTWNNCAQHKPATLKRIRAFNANGSFPLPIPMQRRTAGMTR